MAILTLHRKLLMKLGIPYWMFINGQPIGIMRGKEANIQLPEGNYNIGVKIVFALWKWHFSIGSETQIALTEGKETKLLITDKERWWNILFDIDLVLWLAKLFFELPHPWNIVYEIVSNGFFALWLARIWFIRDRYFKIVKQSLKPNV